MAYNFKTTDQMPPYFETTEDTKIKKIIPIVSGKGGVGKSTISASLAISLEQAGYRVGILDADITGSSQSRIFGLQDHQLRGTEKGILPAVSSLGIKIVSVNFMLQDDQEAVIWRSPIITSVIRQFYSEVQWGMLDVLLIDMPPGTGDVPLTIMQSIPVNGMIAVSSPQLLASEIAAKSILMAKKMNIPVIGIIENMSYFHCPDNEKDYPIFGKSSIDEVLFTYGLKLLAKIPVEPKLSQANDEGKLQDYLQEHPLYDKNTIDLIAK